MSGTNVSVILRDNVMDIITHYIKESSPIKNRTQIINELIVQAHTLKEKNKRLERVLELAVLKNQHFLRELVRSRGEETLKDFEQSFMQKLPEMKELIIEQGIDYGD